MPTKYRIEMLGDDGEWHWMAHLPDGKILFESMIEAELSIAESMSEKKMRVVPFREA